MGRNGGIEVEERRPSIISIIILIAIVLIISAFACIGAFNLVKKSNTKEEIEQVKEEIIKSSVENVSNGEKKKEKDTTIKTKEQEKEENQEYTDEYKKYQELTEEEKKKQEVIPNKYEIEYEEIDNIIKREDEVKKEENNNQNENKSDNENEEIVAEVIPEKFDLRDKIQIEVRDQGGFGLCWDFSLLKSIETNLALKTGNYYDLSESYIDYILSYELSGNYFRRIHNGGGAEYLEYIEGVALESDLPYGDYSIEKYGETIKNLKTAVYVNDYVRFPSSHGTTDEEIKIFRDAVKKHIMNNGSLYCSIASPDNGAEYVNKNNVYYTGKEKNRGYHAVSIIGWDDKYSKENFDCKNKPKKDGAYIAVNSWGYSSQEIIYISYEDSLVEKEISGVLDVSVGEPKSKIRNIKFEDYNLYNKMKENLNSYDIEYNDSKKEINIKEKYIRKISYMTLKDPNIENLKGLENFTELETLNINGCNISDISVIGSLTNLKNLTITNCKIDDITPISKCNKITRLDLSDNNITDFDPIKNLKEIASLSISENKIDNLEFLKEMKKLNSLYMDKCSLTNEKIKSIGKLENMQMLSISYNDISDVSFTKNMDKLNSLFISGNKFSEKIDFGKTIVFLDAENCGLENIDFIRNLPNIQRINLKNNNIKSIKALNKFDTLQMLNLSDNKEIKDLNELKCNVNQLILNDCNINSLEDIGNLKVRILDIRDNQMQYIGENCKFDNIFNLVLDNNKIKDIENLKNLKTLYNLSLINCDIKDVSMLSELKNLYSINLDENKGVTGYNSIKSLQAITLNNCELDNSAEILKNTTISRVEIKNNNITYIDRSVLNNRQNYMLTLDFDKVQNIYELYNSNANNVRLYGDKLKVEKEIILPKSSRIELELIQKSMLSSAFENLVNCKVEDSKVIIDTSDGKYKEIKFDVERTGVEVEYVFKCNVKDNYFPNKVNVITNKYFNNYIVGSKEKNFDIIKVEMIYDNIEDFSVKSYPIEYRFMDNQISLDSNLGKIMVAGKLYDISINTFDKNDIKEYNIDNLYDFNAVINIIGYDKLFDVNYEDRKFRVGQDSIDSISVLELANNKIVDTSILEMFKNAYSVSFNGSNIKSIDTSFLDKFTNLNRASFERIYPNKIKSLLDRGVILTYHAYSNNKEIDEKVIKLDGSKLYLHEDLYELYKTGYQVNVEYLKSSKKEVDIYSENSYDTEFKNLKINVDEKLKKLYVDGLKKNKDEEHNIIITVSGKNIEDFMLQAIF